MFLLFLASVAFLIFYKLFKEFGKAHEIIINVNEEDEKKLKSIIGDIMSRNLKNNNQENSGQDTSASAINPELAEDIAALQNRFPDFMPISFLAKAEEMFDAIFNGFANSHHYILKSMLTADLYESFAAQIERREAKNLRQELLIKHKKTILNKIRIFAEKAEILLTFDVSQMSAMVDSEGVSYDNPKRIYRDVNHRWVFERVFGRDNWILSKTSIEKVN